MKASVLFAVCFSIVATTSSQPTYDLEQQQFCDGDCQPQDLQALQNQFSVLKKEMSSQLQQLKEQVDSLVQTFSGHGRSTVNGTTLPDSVPTSPSGCRTHYYNVVILYLYISQAVMVVLIHDSLRTLYLKLNVNDQFSIPTILYHTSCWQRTINKCFRVRSIDSARRSRLRSDYEKPSIVNILYTKLAYSENIVSKCKMAASLHKLDCLSFCFNYNLIVYFLK